MKTVYPDYYESFKCIAGKCRHNCCIGWEIDIDESTLSFYNSLKGEFGKRLQKNISFDPTPHFTLINDERCPFLNGENLCDIFKELGEHHLCQICSDHPRFYNEFEDRVEAGLGLCCEEAARLIITQKEPLRLLGLESEKSGTLLLRKKIFGILQDRSKAIPNRIEEMLKIFAHPAFELKNRCRLDLGILKWLPVFEGLERLDESWSLLLSKLKESFDPTRTEDFDIFMRDREHEYEQLLCYLIYRHFLKSDFAEDMALCSAFAALIFNLVYALGAVIFSEQGDFTVEDQLEIIRLFSSEIEYSDENLDIIFNELYTEIFDSCN